ncbi:DUF47 domain-containing protein [Microvirga sp. W0021]|uniref:DUF47 domain-containing protein n=1 Tax=Hohaiivirga grylli TaxID=3133970 RepID=A0ABV0BKI8_9HYPH
MRWFQALMPKEERFFELFARHSHLIVGAANALRNVMEGGEKVPFYCQEVIRFEHEADVVAHEINRAVRRSFITPFDRGDIKDLITSMDDAVDQMNKTAKAILLFEVRTFEPQMKEMGDLIVQASQLTFEAVPLLGSINKEVVKIGAITERMTRLEERSDILEEEGIKALFLNHGKTDPMSYIIGHEIYDHLEKVVDRFEDVANEISGIVIEHV